ncbi:GAF domain-containing protein [Flavobacterium sp. WC2421]|uniref:GAF domain-containing protein n=3 Tax=unclassified Flavobacterium TaxID=196869 RepID=A0AB39WB22_9FLAO
MKKYKNRVEDLLSYAILDTDPEEELNEITELVSLVFDMPISLITMVDKDRQWFKARKGVHQQQTKREYSFCKYTLTKPNEVLVIEDTYTDKRFANNPTVTGPLNIRFYAGAPLVTPEGNVLGTLCVLDSKPRFITENQKKALQILAKKTMDFLNIRKLMLEQRNYIAKSAENLIKLTDNIPSTIFQLRRRSNGEFIYDFLSLGDFKLPKNLDEDKKVLEPFDGFNLIHKDYQTKFKKALETSYKTLTTWYFEYKIEIDNVTKWYMVKAEPERLPNNEVVWYGMYHEISSHIAYEKTMEQISFDISHVLRKPVANLMGLSALIKEEQNLSELDLKTYAEYIEIVSEELNRFTKDLNSTYHNKWVNIVDYNLKRRNNINTAIINSQD